MTLHGAEGLVCRVKVTDIEKPKVEFVSLNGYETVICYLLEYNAIIPL
jgi:hypothetical protein